MSTPSPTPWLNQRLGNPPRYRLDHCLGSGAFGDVFLALDLRLGRRVAVKILKGALAKHRDLLIRFEREVALSVALESEHIVQVIDYGIALDEHPFYVMEYLQGQTLSQLLARKGRLSIDQTIAIGIQLCAGLEVAHTGVTLWKHEATVAEPIKIIHRDLKPANIFLVPTPLGELVKILDFGIAKKLHTSQTAHQTMLTQTFLGTFRYAAPEQLRNAWELDERADIYSLGMIFYEMLSGTDPFGVSTHAASRRLEQSWVMAHHSVPPKPLRQQPNCEHISAELEAAVMRCLCKRPTERFASVAELRDALHPVRIAAALTLPAPPETLEPTVPHPLTSEHSPPTQNTTIYRPIAQYVTDQERSDRTIFQAKQPNEGSPSENSSNSMSEDIKSNSQDNIKPSFEPQNLGEVSNINRMTPSDATIMQTPPPQINSPASDETQYQSIPRNAQRNKPVSHDTTILQKANERQVKTGSTSAQPRQPQENGLVGQAKAWLQSSASNYADRIRSQASAEVRYGIYRLFAQLLPVGIGFAFGLASLSGAYYLFRGQLPTVPRQVPSQIK
jgi:serine/threonine-protein kinase